MKKVLLAIVLLLTAGWTVGGCPLFFYYDPCEGVYCGHGTCEVNNGDAICKCDVGYYTGYSNTTCVKTPPPPQPPRNRIILDWTFGPGARTCAEASVSTVRVQAIRGSGTLWDDTLDCTDGGTSFSIVDDGTYTIELTGLSTNEDEWYQASELALFTGDNLDLGTLELMPTGPGDLGFEWSFGQDALDCEAARVSHVRVQVYDQEGNLEYEVDPAPACSDGGALVTGFELGTWHLVLEGVCAADESVGYRLETDPEVSHPGENNFGHLDLVDVGGCP